MKNDHKSGGRGSCRAGIAIKRAFAARQEPRPPFFNGLLQPGRAARELFDLPAQTGQGGQAVAKEPQPPLILGRHVLPYFDNQAGRHIGEVTRAAYEAQADGAFSSEEEALRWLADYFVHAREQIE